MRTESSYADLKSGLTKLLLYLFWQQIRALHSFTPQGQKRTVINSAEPLCRHRGSPPVQTPAATSKKSLRRTTSNIFFFPSMLSVCHMFTFTTHQVHMLHADRNATAEGIAHILLAGRILKAQSAHKESHWPRSDKVLCLFVFLLLELTLLSHVHLFGWGVDFKLKWFGDSLKYSLCFPRID